MFCSLTGEVATEPVLSPKSGHIFERRVIEKCVNETGKDPISNEDLAVDDLIAVHATAKTAKPRPPTATSIPSLLATFQNEWDAVMLETFSLKQQLEQARQELAHSLYQHEAACRVIARLVKERDAARQMLATLQPNLSVSDHDGTSAATADSETMDVDTAAPSAPSAAVHAVPEDVLTKINDTSQSLQKGRRKRQHADTLATTEHVATFKQLSSNAALHSSSSPGIVTVDLHHDGARVLTGGVDKNLVVYDRTQEVILHTLKGHTKRVTAALFHQAEDVIFSSSQDKTVKIWRPSNKGYSVDATLKAHKADVTDLSLHATNEYLGAASLDSTWSLSDWRTGKTFLTVPCADVTKGYTRAQFHPDGLILGAGTVDSVVRMWDIKSVSNVATFESHVGRITDLAFSENGYLLATAAEDSVVKIWDLRKLQCVREIPLGDGKVANALDFDYSGSYLAVGGSNITIYHTKTWQLLTTLSDHSGPVTDVKFDKDARSLASVSMDRSLRFFGLS